MKVASDRTRSNSGQRTISPIPVQCLIKGDQSKVQTYLDSKEATSSNSCRHHPEQTKGSLNSGHAARVQVNGSASIKTNPWVKAHNERSNYQDSKLLLNGEPKRSEIKSDSGNTSEILGRSASYVYYPNFSTTLPKPQNILPQTNNTETKWPQTRTLKILREKSPLYINARCESTCSLKKSHLIVKG